MKVSEKESRGLEGNFTKVHGFHGHFGFTAQEIDAHKSDRKGWYNFVRRREAEMIFAIFPGRRFQLALELGAGNGGQSKTIAQYCEHLICTDKDDKSHEWLGQTILKQQLPNVDYRLCDAQDLSQFQGDSFDLIFSSNLLEHVPDVNKCLTECRRLLKDNGVMLHTMPSRWWKVFNVFLAIFKLKLPEVHGVSRNHCQELWAFGRDVWRKKIEANGLVVEKIIGLPFYVGHANSFIPVIKAGNAIGLPASYLYVLQKKKG